MQTPNPDLKAINDLLNEYINPWHSQKGVYTLDRMTGIMEGVGNPQDNYPVIHVAGTSGKTSTCYYLAALLKSGGMRVGLTVSPHVAGVNERVQIDLEPLRPGVFLDELKLFIKKLKKTNAQPTYFELLIAFSYWYFAKEKVDYAVVEVGLGGLLDGTNVISREDKVCVISDIGFDHMPILGNSLEEIATQKAGIVQPGNNVFTYKQQPAVMKVIEQVVQEKNARLHIVEGSDTQENLPPYQQRNLRLAEQVVKFVANKQKFTIPSSSSSLSTNLQIPGRFETFQVADKKIILDGAHNPQELRALFDGLTRQHLNNNLLAVVAMSERNKTSITDSMATITDHTKECIATTFSQTQDLPKKPVPPEVLFELAKKPRNVSQVEENSAAMSRALATDYPVILVTGSLYLVSEVRARLVAHASSD